MTDVSSSANENPRFKPPYIDVEMPSVYNAMEGVAVALGSAFDEVELDRNFVELAYVRASQLNGCSTCLSVHVPRALSVGVTQQQIDLLPSWRHAKKVYSDAEKMVIEMAEVITRLPEDASYEDLLSRAREFFTKEQLVALEWGIIAINAFNRVSVVSQHPVRKRPRN
ncbi:carboxymuconolactone decarboxylase family protein [Arcanobacterium pinnipediorum]|uniref:Carboxymuconolactone decarboxylase family protein n=1 Tax=Arcanobacterium pinnipediorum TaxID=1503041 RepID=A0ABY5AHF2_9ACTO|nr:carboxymuconolactone decarboxylase family protein [Arcanobacterium pinnipediorum]USR79348.1 carboxymuconolactone decarboxylase family protein [Arcanobacterium pinnipediorum]